jgi:transcriptional regulator with XRE-family HTH domain/mannose-6-phosphate isomerase-like protein (cupin superfamily)
VDQSVKTTLGSKIREVRTERGLSQRELAALAGISANAISLIERNENSPSVSTLQSLATALNVKVSYFFEEEEPGEILFVRASQRPASTGHGVRIEGVGAHLHNQELEPFVVHLAPHSGSGKRLVIHTGHELVYCLEGEIEYVIDDAAHRLAAGDLLLFEAHLPHSWYNPTEGQASFLLVLQTPDESEISVKRHFVSHPSLPHLR